MSEDYEKQLMEDLEEFSNDENEANEPHEAEEPQVEHGGEESLNKKFEKILNSTNRYGLRERINQLDIRKSFDITENSQIYPLIPQLKDRIKEYSDDQNSDYMELLAFVNEDSQSEEYKFIISMNELSQVINEEVSMAHLFIKVHYKVVFPELETLVLNPIDYAKVIILIKQDLTNIKAYENQLRAIVSNETSLVIQMAAIQQLKNQFTLNQEDFNMIVKACLFIMDLNDLLEDFSLFMLKKLSKFAPNVSALVGPITTSQLLISSGSLRLLLLTPSCNLPSLGTKALSSQKKERTVRQAGFLYHSDLVKNLPLDIVRPAMRILSGKVILAARVDLSRSDPSGTLGAHYLEEVRDKIEKLLAPPEVSADKALPVPKEQKSRRRGGKRFRKQKERFLMSELRKAQNKMAFGKEEESVLDGFGEEIGLGMSRLGAEGSLAIQLNPNTRAKMSKALSNRLAQLHKKPDPIGEDLDSIIMSAPSSTLNSASVQHEQNSHGNKWLTSSLERKRKIESTDHA